MRRSRRMVIMRRAFPALFVCAMHLVPRSRVPFATLDDGPFCEREDIRRGKWFPLERTEEDNATDDLLYRWENPGSLTNDTRSSCRFKPDFDSELFCNLMTNTVVWILGDSIMWEMYASLVKLATNGSLLLSKRIRINSRVNHHGTRRGFPVMVNPCNNNNVTLTYRWTCRLEEIDKMFTQQFPTMIVLNTGAYYMPDDQYRARMRHMIGQMEGWQQLCRERNLTCPFYWRTSAPGIPHCMTFTSPVNDIAEMERLVETESPGAGEAPPFYNWEKFRHQNEIAYEMLESSALSYDVIPGYEIGIQRPDTRVSEMDCLHSSNPAIADAENIVLLHYLRTSRTAEDVAGVTRYRYEFDRATNINPEGTDLDWALVKAKDYPY